MDRNKLSPHFVWLFALVAVVGGLGISFVTAKAGWKVSAAAFFGFVGLMAFLGGYLTRASALQAVLPFVLASGALGAVYYAIVKSVMSAAATVCEFDVAPTAIASVTLAGEAIVCSPASPRLPAAATTAMPDFSAADTAAAHGSHAAPAGWPQVAPWSSGDHSEGGSPEARIATSMPSLKAHSSAVSATSAVVESFTPGEPKIL